MHEFRLGQVPAGWEARIVTLLNQVWVEPDGARALTFTAATPEEAERLPAAAIERDSIARGHRILDPSRSGGPTADRGAARRVTVSLPVRFMPRGAGSRREGVPASPPGMGVRLLDPPLECRARIQSLG